MAATHVEAVTRLAGPGPKRILELGAGSGFTSAALASAGHDVVAIDLVDACVESIARLADDIQRGSLAAIAGDFYSVEVEGSSTSSVTSMGSASAPTTTSVACCAGSLHGSPPAAAPSSTCSPRGTGRRCPVRGKSSRLEAESSTKKGSTPKVVGWLSVCGEKGTKTRPSPSPSDAIHRRISASCSRRSACPSWRSNHTKMSPTGGKPPWPRRCSTSASWRRKHESIRRHLIQCYGQGGASAPQSTWSSVEATDAMRSSREVKESPPFGVKEGTPGSRTVGV